jgi:hypothetical protein
MRRIRLRRPSPALAIAFVALVFSIAGTATAAKFLITSSRQIKNGVIQTADLSKKARNALKGARGPAGATGAPGAQGPQGPKGDIGPSNVFEAVRPDFVTIAAGGADTGVATLSNLPAGDYLVIARLGLNTGGTTIARVVCTATLGSSSSQGIVQIGSDPSGVGQAPVTIVFAGSLASTGSAHVGCHSENLSGGAPFAGDTHLEAVKVGAAASQTVTS